MHDPLTVAFVIRRPWPRIDRTDLTPHVRTGEGRWEMRLSPFWILAGRRLYWPSLITVWHRDPSNSDDITCGRTRWRTHVHHWRIQVHPYQQLRRRFLTRCAWCAGRSIKGDPVNISHSWDGPRARWWQGEPDLFHHDCSEIQTGHATCVCTHPALEQGIYGRCARCQRFRPFGITDVHLAGARELHAIPAGARTHRPPLRR
ncbi:hypothetical protein ABZZ36_40250 [Actinacidiphila glaucinigra]|uniref:hypothetical protein n=1 Tax=Actinacidiphila glaucinigra TaxID=235986 RepID=UPI0033A84928